METLTLISLVIGILVGIIAMLEKFFHILPRNRGAQKMFEQEFSEWKESAYSHVASHDDLRRFAGYVLRNQLDYERNTFALLCAIQHGDKLMHDLINKNQTNPTVVPFVFDFVSGRGIRVEWRAEYVLSRLDQDDVKKYIDQLPEASKRSENLAASIQRILHSGVEDFLRKQFSGEDQKLKTYANEVLKQIQSRAAPRPSSKTT